MTGTGYVANRSLPPLDGKRTQPAPTKPLNVGLGGTTANNLGNGYGSSRSPTPFPDGINKKQYFAGRGTTQDRNSKTILPGDF